MSAKVGKGHFARCNEIAKALTRQGAQCVAIISLDSTLATVHHFNDVYTVSPADDALQTARLCNQLGIKTILVDHYHCDSVYQRVLKSEGLKLAQYDNRCDGHYESELLININPAACKQWYQHCSFTTSPTLLLGIQFAVLNPSVAEHSYTPSQRGLFICFGGGDDGGASYHIAKQLSEQYVYPIHLACSDTSRSATLYTQEQPKNIQLHLNQQDLLAMLRFCDVALITAGTLSYEMCYLGLPFAYGTIADNQVNIAQAWQQLDIGLNLGPLENPLTEVNLEKLLHFMNSATPSKQGERLDANGANRIAEAILCL